MNRIYLLGFMGAGKTTVGKALAKQLNWTFLDLDHYIESVSGQTVSEIFSEEGEGAFRNRERQALEDTFRMERVVVATGGGCPCFLDNMDAIRARGFAVFLDCVPADLARRLRGQRHDRPLLSDLEDGELENFISNLLHQRRPVYLTADLVVDAGRNVSTVVNDLVMWFRKMASISQNNDV